MIARYVDPLVGYLREMMRYRKYKQGTKLEIDDALRSDKAENPKRIPYYLSIAHEHPGAFMLSYIRAVNPHHEYISLSPNGFRYRKKNFDSIDKLVGYFQKHFNDPIPEAPIPSRRAVAAMVPPRSPSSYSAGSYGYSAGSRKPSDSGGSGYDSRMSWGDRGGNSRGSGGGWGRGAWGGRGSGNSGWDKGSGRSGADNGGTSSGWDTDPSSRSGWDKSGGSGRGGWENSGGSSREGVWDKGTVTGSGGGGAWDSSVAGGSNWGDKSGNARSGTAGNIGWDSGTNVEGGTGDGWASMPASSGWDPAQAGGQGGFSGRGGARDSGWNQGGRGGGGRDRGGWDQGGGGRGGVKSNGWSSDISASPARKPAPGGWKEGGSTPSRSGNGVNNWEASSLGQSTQAGTPARAPPAGGCVMNQISQ